VETNQLAIKFALIAASVIFALFLLLPGRGVRHVALRRISLLGLFLVALVAIVFPSVINTIANAMGVGRGADLLLYGLIIVFVGNSVVAQRRHRILQSEITQLARRIAITQAAMVFQESSKSQKPGD
jgi:hypothetical protein